MDQKQKDAPIPATDTPSLSGKVNVPLRNCKVVLEDISIHSVAGKHNTLKQCQGNPDRTASRGTIEKKSLQDLTVKRPISSGKINDKRWSTLDSAVQAQLHPCNTLSVRVKLLEDTIYSEASKIFGYCTIFPKRNLAGKTRRTLLSINLIKQKNLLLTQISSTVDHQEQASLKELLAPIKEKIRNFRCAEKHRKKSWLFKKSQEKFMKNPYQAGKELLDSKSDAKLTVDQLTLDKFKSASVENKFYDVPLNPLEGLPSSPNLKVPFSSKSLSFDEFSTILASRRNASCPGLNAIPYKVYKQGTQIRKLLFNIFFSCLKHSVVPLQWRYAMEHFIPKTKPPCPSNIKDFRPIALLNVEGKLFFRLISKRLVNHIITNNNLSTHQCKKAVWTSFQGVGNICQWCGLP